MKKIAYALTIVLFVAFILLTLLAAYGASSAGLNLIMIRNEAKPEMRVLMVPNLYNTGCDANAEVEDVQLVDSDTNSSRHIYTYSVLDANFNRLGGLVLDYEMSPDMAKTVSVSCLP